MKLHPVEHDPDEVARILAMPEIAAALRKPMAV